MRKKLLIPMLMCAITLVVAQSNIKIHYWFDNLFDTIMTLVTNDRQVHIDIDVPDSDLTFRALHVQAEDSLGVPGAIQTRFFIYSKASTSDQVEYWFDHDRQSAVTLSPGINSTQIDVSMLDNGIHYIHIQSVGATPSHAYTRLFYKAASPVELKQVRYWFDNEGASKAKTLAGPIIDDEIDVTPLTDGLHCIYVQSGTSNPSAIQCRQFIKTPQLIGQGDVYCMTYIDNKPHRKDKVNAGTIIHYDMDAVDIEDGIHMVTAQLVLPSGAVSSSSSSYFLRVPLMTEIGKMQCYYKVDGGDTRQMAGRFSNGDFHFDLDVASLSDGLHNLVVTLCGEKGEITSSKTTFFQKVPLGGNGIRMYQYWINEDYDGHTLVNIENRTEEMSIMTLLPVKSFPFRSSNFHFEIVDGVPMVYAQNTFHVRFYDAAYRSTDMDADYIDYNIGNKVENVEALYPDVPVTKSCPSDNEIRWFKLSANIGDNISVKTDKACTIQIFTPSGNTMYSATGDEATSYVSNNAFENGDYYVAVHDVTTKQSGNITVSYRHIDKYAVLKHSPEAVGKANGLVTLSLFGNGYDKLVEATLSREGHEITSETIYAEDPWHAFIEMPMTDREIELGTYDLVLHFDESGEKSDLVVEKAIKVNPAEYGEIKVSVTSYNVTTSPFPVTITVENTGNVEYRWVPFVMAYTSPAEMESVELDFDIMTDSIGLQNLEDIIEHTDNLLGRGISADGIVTVIPSLPPNAKMDYQLRFLSRSNSRFHVYSWVNTPWSIMSGGKGAGISLTTNTSSLSWEGTTGAVHIGGNNNGTTSKTYSPVGARGSNPTCDEDPCLATIGDPGFSGCLCGFIWGIASTFGNIYAGISNWEHKKQNEYDRQNGGDGNLFAIIPLKTPRSIVRGMLLSCLPGGIPSNIATALASWGLDILDNPCPDPPAHPTQRYVPIDPNEIHGYVAESGSTYIGKEVKTVGYDIEFENDSEFATSGAHHIVITNRLDKNKFKPTSFGATRVSIGSHIVELSGEKSFVKTIDYRPEVNVICQVKLDYDETTATAVWDFQALDPMTLDPTEDIMMSILPVNNNGDGIGTVSYDIDLADNLKHNDKVTNKAEIIFDNESPIVTPVWANTLDYVSPTSVIESAVYLGDGKSMLQLQGNDDDSGLWYYIIYSRESETSPWETLVTEVKDNIVNVSSTAQTEFSVAAVDMAGNIEADKPDSGTPSEEVLRGDTNGDGKISVGDVTSTIADILGNRPANFVEKAADMDSNGKVTVVDVTSIISLILNQPRQAPKSIRISDDGDLSSVEIDDVRISNGMTAQLGVKLPDAEFYVAATMDIRLPVGITLESVNLSDANSSTHQVAYSLLDGNIVRIMVYSLQNAYIPDENLLEITVAAEANAAIDGTSIIVDNIAVNSIDSVHNIIDELRLADTMSYVAGDISGCDDIVEMFSVYVLGHDVNIDVSHDCYMMLTNCKGQNRVISLSQGINTVTIPASGVYILNNRKIVIK